MNPVRLNIQPQGLSLPQIQGNKVLQSAEGTNAQTFKDTLADFVSSVNDLQTKAADTQTNFLKGEITDVHQVMIAVEQASVSFELLMEIRNKLLESYQQIMRMPM